MFYFIGKTQSDNESLSDDESIVVEKWVFAVNKLNFLNVSL